jgi:hypothetical protein
VFSIVQAASSGGGGGGGTDWTANERTAIRSILGVPTSGTTPTDPTSGILDTIRDKTNLITTETVFITSDASNGSSITVYKNEVRSISVPLDEDITSKTVRFIVEDDNGADVFVVENASISRTSTTFSFTTSTTLTDALGDYKWALRDITSGNRLISGGVLSVRNAADVDA